MPLRLQQLPWLKSCSLLLLLNTFWSCKQTSFDRLMLPTVIQPGWLSCHTKHTGVTEWCVSAALFLFTRYILKQQLHLRWVLFFTIFYLFSSFNVFFSCCVFVFFSFVLVLLLSPLLLLLLHVLAMQACNAWAVLFLTFVS